MAAGEPGRVALAANPPAEEATSWGRLAQDSFAAGDYARAIEALRRVAALEPQSAVARYNLAVTLRRARRPVEAEAENRRALELDPNYLPGYWHLATLLRERGELAAALSCYRRIAAAEPDNAMAYNDAGLMLKSLRRRDEARAAFAHAHALQPGDPRIRFNQLMLEGDAAGLAEAVDCCRRLLGAQPDNPELLANLAAALRILGRYEEALVVFERVIALAPDYTEARFDRAVLWLLRGDFARGWPEYEQRLRLPQARRRQPISCPRWQGEPLGGKTILLHAEQGLGDTIQFLRYLPAVAARGGRLAVQIERPLVRLAHSLPVAAIVLGPGDPLPELAAFASLLSLPHIFGTRVETIPATVPYLAADPATAARWQRRLADLAGLKVGLVWAGNPQHPDDARRSIGVQRLLPLFDIAGVSWINLQKDARDRDGPPSGRLLDISPQLADFAETAGAIANLDLVIAVDTAVAHLAGALGRPVWTLLAFSPDWRWLLDREDSPWYPTMRLFRQRAPDDWDEVVARVAAVLRQSVGGSSR